MCSTVPRLVEHTQTNTKARLRHLIWRSLSLVIACAIIAVLPHYVAAHSWYPWECCSDQDCYPLRVARENIERRDDGWFLLKERITVPFDAARTSPDADFHICRNEHGRGSLITPKDKPPCFWAPAGQG